MSLKSLSVVAAAAMALCAGAAQADTTNLFANGGFETVGVTTPALGWGQADAGYTLSADAYMGSFAMLLAVAPASTPHQGYQNSVEDGGLPALTAGDIPVFSFWAKGETLFTGNAQFFLQYLDPVGNILYNSNSQEFQGQLNSDSWTQITFEGPAVPVGATAALTRFVSAAGPVIPEFDLGVTANRVLIDNVFLGTEGEVEPPPIGVIPEPETYALMLMGLAAVGVAARRRRST